MRVRVIPALNESQIEKNVAIYCRVSSSSRDQLNSLVNQISALTNHVFRIRQWRLKDTFIDIGSASGSSERIEFERLIRECESDNIDIVITKSISRFGRDAVDTLRALKRIKEAGAIVYFYEEGLDTGRAGDDMMISVMEAVAQAENEARSENIRMGLAMRAATGKSGNYRRLAYGYVKDSDGSLVIDEEKAEVVRNIFQWYLEGASVLGIIKKLADEKIASPTGKEKWCKAQIDKMLENEKYIGIVMLSDPMGSDRAYMFKECNPPIIENEVFKAVQKMRLTRSNTEYDENGNRMRKRTKYSSKRSAHGGQLRRELDGTN